VRILIVGESEEERRAMARDLAERAHTVHAVAAREMSPDDLAGGEVDVVVFDWSTGDPSTVALLRGLRAAERGRRTYAIVVMTNAVVATVAAAFQAGADDLLRRPFPREDLVGRVSEVERIRRWVATSLARNEELGARLARVQSGKVGDRAIREDMAALLRRPLEARASSRGLWRSAFGAEIPLVLDEGLECRLQLGMDQESVAHTAEVLLGSEARSSVAIDDMLREMVNVAGGAFVGAAELDGIRVTLGLPTNLAPHTTWERAAGTAQELTLGLADGSAELTLRVLVVSRERGPDGNHAALA